MKKCLIFSGVFIFINAFWAILSSHAQVITNAGQDLFIGPGTEFTVVGAMINEGVLENQGTVYLSGNWDNGSNYKGDGALYLTGQNQTVNHNGGIVGELVIDGGSEKTFTSDIRIAGSFQLQNGVVTPKEDVKIIASNSATVTDGHDQSFVNGAFFHEGNGIKLFPIGKNRHYSPATFEIYSGSPLVGLEVIEPNNNPFFVLELREISSEKYWEQSLISGTIGEGSLITLPMEIRNTDANLEEIVIAAASSDENYKPLETIAQTGFINDGTITSKAASTAHRYAIGLTAERPEERSIYIPNAFAPLSPKAGVEEDRIKVYGREISSRDFLFRIYNRWGALVYETTSLEQATTVGWDGINKQTGKAESMGSYKYSLRGKFNSGSEIERSGTIHLIY